MISLERLEEPEILKKNKVKWMKSFLQKNAERPPSSQYAHREIKDSLRAMSFNKCFYCECKLGAGKDERPEIDHYIGIAEHPELAFEWSNLYLSCFSCNRCKNHSKIIVSECLDPCETEMSPADHLTFENEYIRPKNNSRRGSKTIQRCKLDREGLDYLRVKRLQKFERFLRKLRERQIREGGRGLTPEEREAINSFKAPHHAFSLMFSVYFVNLEL